jgi:hypothetical protein
MKLDEIKRIAQRHDIGTGKMNKTELIHAIQGAEGNNKCFNTGISSTCGGMSCLWKEECDHTGAIKC